MSVSGSSPWSGCLVLKEHDFFVPYVPQNPSRFIDRCILIFLAPAPKAQCLFAPRYTRCYETGRPARDERHRIAFSPRQRAA
jgi:hypothetical protein